MNAEILLGSYMFREKFELGEIERPRGVTYGFPRLDVFADQFIRSVEADLDGEFYDKGTRPEAVKLVLGIANYADAMMAALQDSGMKPDLTEDFKSTPRLITKANQIYEDSLRRWIEMGARRRVPILGVCGLPLVAKGFTIRQTLYQLDQQLTESFQEHQDLPSSGESLVIPILIFEFPAITSLRIEDRQVGLPMGNEAVEKLARRQAPFNNLNYADPYVAGIAIRFKVRQMAAELREISQKNDMEVEEKVWELRKRGVDMDVPTPEEIEDMAKGANIRKVAILYGLAESVLYYMNEQNLLDLPDRFKGKEGFEELAKDPSAIDDLIVKVLLVKFIRDDLGIPDNRAFIGDNKTLLPKISYPAVSTINVIGQFYPINI